MRASRLGRKAAVAVLVGGVLVAGIGVAWAATTSSGKGNGVVHVAKGTTGWTIGQTVIVPYTVAHPTTGDPGPTTPALVQLRFTVKDIVPGNLWLNSLNELSGKVLSAKTAAPGRAADGETGTTWTAVNHRPIPHCTPTWFKVLTIHIATPNVVLPMKFKMGSFFDVFLEVAFITMGAGVNQNGCLGSSPAVQLTVAP